MSIYRTSKYGEHLHPWIGMEAFRSPEQITYGIL